MQQFGTQLHSRSGRYLGQVEHGKVFDTLGRYSGTIVGDRVVYRTVDSSATSTPSSAPACPAIKIANGKGSSLWGVEPPFAD